MANAYVEIPNSGEGGLVVINTSATANATAVIIPRVVIVPKTQSSVASLSYERASVDGNIHIYSSVYTAVSITYISLKI